MRLVIESTERGQSCRVLEDHEPTYAELWAEREMLLKELESLKRQAQDNWDLAETIACGEKLLCITCNQYHPCDCDKS